MQLLTAWRTAKSWNAVIWLLPPFLFDARPASGQLSDSLVSVTLLVSYACLCCTQGHGLLSSAATLPFGVTALTGLGVTAYRTSIIVFYDIPCRLLDKKTRVE